MITLASPHWYRSRSGFHTAAFGTFFGRTMRRAHRSMTCHPSKSSSGGSSGSSGGGCSGGGSGGGGGSSW